MVEREEIDVLICGAGAAGLTLAIDLARRGISFRLIDKLDKPFGGSRGKGIQPRTLEVFEDLGIVDRMALVGSTYPAHRVYRSDGSYEEAQDAAIEPPTQGESYRVQIMVPQFRTEAVMHERLAEYGAAPDYGCELQAFEQGEDFVTAQLVGSNGDERVRCRYLVGGDGGRSFVRHRLQIGFPGKTMDVQAMVADLVVEGLSRDAWHRFNEGDMARQFSLCPLPHTDLFQLQAPISAVGDADLTVEAIQAFIDARVAGNDVAVRQVAWASAYRMNARLADRYRSGPVFLMGDAAHIHPPTDGQRLNTSVQDAYNLGWKLDAVLAGSPDRLLDTYEEERRPIAAAMLGLSTRLLDQAKQGDIRRGREVQQLDLAYCSSSLSLQLPGRHDGVLAGERAPDALLRGAGGQPRRLYDLLRGPHWTMITCGGANTGLKSNSRLRIFGVGDDCEFRDPDKSFHESCGLSRGDLLLIRPDSYVAASATQSDRSLLELYMNNASVPADAA